VVLAKRRKAVYLQYAFQTATSCASPIYTGPGSEGMWLVTHSLSNELPLNP